MDNKTLICEYGKSGVKLENVQISIFFNGFCKDFASFYDKCSINHKNC